MIGFEVIDDSLVVFRHKFIYKQSPLYKRGGLLYLKASGGYVKLYKDSGRTMHPDIHYEDIEGVEVKKQTKHQYIEVK